MSKKVTHRSDAVTKDIDVLILDWVENFLTSPKVLFSQIKYVLAQCRPVLPSADQLKFIVFRIWAFNYFALLKDVCTTIYTLESRQKNVHNAKMEYNTGSYKK